MTPMAPLPVDYVQIKVFERLTGYTADAIQKKIRAGVFRQGKEWQRAPDGRVLISLQGYHNWVEGN